MEPQSYWDIHPLHAGGHMIRIGKAEIDDLRPDARFTKAINHDPGHLHYRKSNVFVNMILPIDVQNFFIPQIDINYVTFEWDKNPKFNENHFYYLQFGLVYYTTAIEHWRWIFRFDYNLQTEHMSHPGQYSLYNGLLWGSYKIHPKWHCHVGALGYAGLEGEMVYPIIGLDFSPNHLWHFELIFPINYAVDCRFAKGWTLSLKGRPLKERLRTGSREPQPRSIFSYSSIGAELNLQYEIERRLTAEIYGGYSGGGSFYIKNAGGHNAVYADVQGAPYIGAKLDVGF